MSSAAITLAAERERLEALTGFLHGFWTEVGLPEEALFHFDLALEELFLNVASYGVEEGRIPQVTVELAHEGNAVRMTLQDDGPAFNPLHAPEADTSLPIEQRQIGGLGIHLVRKTMDSMDYQRQDGCNRVTLRCALTPR